MSAYVYVRSEPDVYTVGFYDPEGHWCSESDHDTRDEAAARVAYLNGGPPPAVRMANVELVQALDDISTIAKAAVKGAR